MSVTKIHTYTDTHKQAPQQRPALARRGEYLYVKVSLKASLMDIYALAHIHVKTWIHRAFNMQTHKHLSVLRPQTTQTQAQTQAQTHICILHICKYLSSCISVCIYLCTHTCMQTYICIDTAANYCVYMHANMNFHACKHVCEKQYPRRMCTATCKLMMKGPQNGIRQFFQHQLSVGKLEINRQLFCKWQYQWSKKHQALSYM